MTDSHIDSQILVPDAFCALYTEPRSQRLRVSRALLHQRHELCEDLAQLLVDTARAQSHGGAVSEEAVLLRCHDSLLQEGSGLSAPEAGWVIARLAELLEWPQPTLPEPPR